MAEIEAIIEPDGVGDDIWREAVTFVCFHPPILPISASLLGSTLCSICCYSSWIAAGISSNRKSTRARVFAGINSLSG